MTLRALSQCAALALCGVIGACTQTKPAAPATAPQTSAVATSQSAAAPSTLPLLRVGISGDYAPFATGGTSQPPTGFDIELAKQLAHDLGFDVAWVTFTWPELGERVAQGAFDVAMSGVTWQPQRAVSGYMTRAVAHGGPCVLGNPAARRIGVNHGGVLEAWARRKYVGRELVVVDDNQGLPGLLTSGGVDAIVTDSFERRSFQRSGVPVHCEPALSQKVYWVAPARSRELGPRVDAWLATHVANVQQAQERWFGERQRLDASSHLVDLLARRFAFMPLVAALKAARNLPIEDGAREHEVLEGVRQSAHRLGLAEQPVVALFRLQIELSKTVQRRQSEPSNLDLGRQIRPVLTSLGEQILEALVAARADLAALSLPDLEAVSPWLSSEERQQLLSALRALE